MNDFAVVNPATGETIKSYPTVTDAELTRAIDAADRAFHAWSASTTPQDRAVLIRNVARLHHERRNALADIIVKEMGKPRRQALAEVGFCVDIYEYYADNGPALLADMPIDLHEGNGSAFIRQQPVGTLLGIMPWNYPYYQVARFAGPNLVIGNPILLKHAPQCPESAASIEKIYSDAGFPAGAYTNLYAALSQIERIIADPTVQGISLTGSERAGAAVAQLAGKYLKKVVLEMGGSDPFILLGTHDMDATVKAAVAARIDNSGQACNAAKRFIVLDTLYDDFITGFTAAIQAISPRDPAHEDTTLGPLSSAGATNRLADQVNRIVAGGAKLVGGAHRDNFFEAGVLTDIAPDNHAAHEELFGPVASVYKVHSEAEAIHVANDTPFGLGSYVFTTDSDQAMRVANALQAGMVFINAVGAESAQLPFGGVKRSGFGRELGTLGISEFVNKKLIRIC